MKGLIAEHGAWRLRAYGDGHAADRVRGPLCPRRQGMGLPAVADIAVMGI